MPIQRVLIANRGEIALRVVRACRDLGFTSIAVFSDADRTALYVRLADEAYGIGGLTPAESYLDAARIIETAQRVKADAIHPGYGFLSENAGFAAAVVAAGLVFIGPAAETIELLGNKSRARAVMQEAGVPIVPGTGVLASLDEAVQAAAGIGYPVMVKATAGGGGRGIRVVHSEDELRSAVPVAQSEALQAFGDGSVYIEKYLHPVRHIEAQVMADQHGTVVSLGERECSIQRRHQKLLEEAPSSAVTPDIRQRLIEASVAAARATNYVGAGTVEFVMDEHGDFYFLEVNTRIQVEHGITELITGRDLVKDQLRVANGEPLGYGQQDIEWRGWAMECRVVAEDPYAGFVPSLGVITAVHEPSGSGIRVDSSLYRGLEVTPYYDSLLSKVLTWGATRDEAIVRMRRALAEYAVMGVQTNLPFHLELLKDANFLAGKADTDLAEALAARMQESAPERERVAAVAAALLAHAAAKAPVQAHPGTQASAGTSPWVAGYRPGAQMTWHGRGR